jgi:hypothetical protein
MARFHLWPLLMRLLALLAGCCLVAVLFRLIGAILSSVMPPPLLAVLVDGWNEFWTVISPAVAPLAAIGIVIAIVWLVHTGRKS